MEAKIIEAEHALNEGNWGKFLLLRPDEEWRYRSAMDDLPLLRTRGWGGRHIFVMDLETGEGAMFPHGGLASADLNERRIWVCPLFEPFLAWLYKQDITDLSQLPNRVQLPQARFDTRGYRRPGPNAAIQLAADALNLHDSRHNDVTMAATKLLALAAGLLSRGLSAEPGEEKLTAGESEIIASAVHSVGGVYTRLDRDGSRLS